MLRTIAEPELPSDDGTPEGAVAIVGMSCRVAGARSLEAYWQLLRDGREGIETCSEEELLSAGVTPATLRKPHYVRRCAPLEDMECFDAGLFGLSPRDAAIMDPQHRHFLECCWEALENAGHVPRQFPGAIGVFAGSGHNAYMPRNLLTNPRLVRDVGLFLLRHTSNDKDFLTTRVSYLLDLTGPSINVQTACSTSLVSIHMAAQSLLSGECDMAIAGGASIELPHRHGYFFEEGEILSPDGHCRPFDVNSKGTVFGSGVAVVVLRRLQDALESGDHVYAVVRGSAINNDGAGKVGYLAPSVDGQAKVIAEALAIGEIDPSTVSYVEAHGTGTPVGDPIELAALTQAFSGAAHGQRRCAIGSVKGNIGHTDTAAGAAGFIKVALSLHHRELPRSINFTSPNPDCAFDESPFVVQNTHSEWTSGGSPLRAGVSSLGVGGTNAHVVLEEAPPRLGSGPSRPTQLLVVSAKSGSALRANVAAHADHLAANPAINLADAAYTLSVGRQHLAQRCFAVAGDTAEALQTLLEEADRIDSSPPCIPDRPVAFLFCGAGSQHVDMARDLYEAESGFRSLVDDGLAAVDRLGLPDIRRWLFPRTEDRSRAQVELERPSIALPALFVIQVALARFWMSLGIQPTGMIGHSSGEYAAAHIAGVIDLEAGLRIVSARGRLFEDVERGGMLSVPMAEADLAPLLPPELAIAAINSPRLCVVSGPSEAILRLRDNLAEQEVEAQIVRISVAAHSPMLDPILPRFREILEGIVLRPPSVPFASNLTGDWVSDSQATSVDYWVRHLRQTVRFTDGLQRLLDDPERVLLEVGPGRAMASLVRQHPERPRNQPVLSSLPHPDQPDSDHRFFLSSLGELWKLGVSVDWNEYWRAERRSRLPLPTYQFERERHWIEPGNALLAEVEDDSLDRHDDVCDWYFEPVWTREGRRQVTARHGTALVFEDQAGLSSAIASELRASGRDVIFVKPGRRFRQESDNTFSIDPTHVAHYAQLFDRLSAVGPLPTEVYHCWGVDSHRAHPDIHTCLNSGFFSLMALAPQLARQVGEGRVNVAFVTTRAHRVCGEGAPMPAKAAAVAALPVIEAEYPSLHLRGIDLTLPPTTTERSFREIAGEVIAELSADESDAPVCFRDGTRWALDHQPKRWDVSSTADRSSIRAGATYLITGGLGGLGLTIAHYLAERGANVALINRSPLPPREEWSEILTGGGRKSTVERIRKMLAIEATGAKIEVIAADVADVRAMRRAIRQIRTNLGPVTGVFHTAGTLNDGLIETRTRSEMEQVLRPKVAGTLALATALRNERPEFLLLFSSISAFAGLPGQADYAAANAFLDAYAESRRDDPYTRVRSIGWSQWSEVGMAAALGEASSTSGSVPDVGLGEAVDHPFLDWFHVVGPDLVVASALLSPDTHWLLGEHRISGIGAVIPGTGYLELVRATHDMIEPGLCALSDVLFISPFVVVDGEQRELRVQLQRRAGHDWRFLVLGRPAGTQGDWTEHASGTVRSGHAEKVSPLIDLESIEARCSDVEPGPIGKSHALSFGPRWKNVRHTAMGEGEALIYLALPERFKMDLESLALHPALLDLATAGAQPLIPGYDAESDFFAPFSYRRITMHAPLQMRMVSHIRYRAAEKPSASTATFDIIIADEAGQVLASIDGFTLMRVGGGFQLERAANGALPPKSLSSGSNERLEGILPEQGLEVLEHILSAPACSHVIASPFDLRPLLQKMRKPPSNVRRTAIEAEDGATVELPATPMEHTIAELWEGLLGVTPVGRNESFFDLGGHSLLAVQFTNRLRKRTGKVLPLGALLESPTIKQLAQLIEPNEASEDGTSAVVNPEAHRAVVTIRAGGTLTPIFFIHDGLGETLLYRGLALRLDPERPVYGVEPLRTADGSFAHTRISEMAANYIERIRSVQPSGPYLLAGLCAGGVIAFEMAQQLQVMDERVAFVGIVDAADVGAAKRPFYITRQRLKRLASLMREGADLALVPALARRLSNAVAWEIETRIRRVRDRKAVQRMEGSHASAETPVPGRDIPSIGFLQLYEVAHRAHRPKGLFSAGEVTLFKATQGSGEIEDIPYQEIFSDYALGWGKRMERELSVVPVPGGHGSALQEPHVGTLAARFQDAIDSVMADELSTEAFTQREAVTTVAAVAAE